MKQTLRVINKGPYKGKILLRYDGSTCPAWIMDPDSGGKSGVANQIDGSLLRIYNTYDDTDTIELHDSEPTEPSELDRLITAKKEAETKRNSLRDLYKVLSRNIADHQAELDRCHVAGNKAAAECVRLDQAIRAKLGV